MRVRALVKNKVMLILTDSGSSHSFINTNMVEALGITPTATKPVSVQVANGDQIVTKGIITNMEWWSQGHTFHWDMKVIDIGAYDAILGYDWLAAHSPMVCDWKAKSISFADKGANVQLTSVPGTVQPVEEISVEQLCKWHLGNEIWALAIVKCCSLEATTLAPEGITELLH